LYKGFRTVRRIREESCGFMQVWMVTYGGAFHVENVLSLGIYLYCTYLASARRHLMDDSDPNVFRVKNGDHLLI